MSIEIKNITKIFGQQKALDDVSFSVDTGSIVGFLGPNGAGKSTLMKIITGLISPDNGQVVVNGVAVAENTEAIRKTIGYLPESNPLYYDMYVKEYLQFTANIYKIKETGKVVDDVIERTGLGNECKKKIGALSKGYKQRVGIAQAIIHNPQVLILDEPTTGLDPNQIVEIRNLILELGRDKTIMLSTHIMQEVQAVCSRIAILDHGRLVANGDTNQILKSNSGGNQIVEVEFNCGFDEQLLKQIANIVSIEPLGGNKYVVESDTDTDLRQSIFNFAVQNNLVVLTMQTKQNTIEEVFQKLTHN
ncbi:MAG: gliding motility-associated ABC transporter ATP-binding subunit GldA [Salinivirgaceae bacterium]|nr:gliding motility-associated ABC transporter ATP-binding subunit GldA [Salinivirgaceae bacterium]